MSSPAGVLFVVATPLGNLDDFSPRAVRTLAAATRIYAEDTRRSHILLESYGVQKSLRSLHEHNERERIDEVLAALSAGEAIALLTDAGTPAVSDPGARVVAAAAAAGFTIHPIPGASALTAALSVAGFDSPSGGPGTLFMGFLPARGSERREALGRVSAHEGVVVLFEAPHRLATTLGDLAAATPARAACVARELTKLHEELRRGRLDELASWASEPVKGELTIVLAPVPAAPAISAEDRAVDDMLARCLAAGLSARDASTAVAAISDRPRREVYARCQKLTHEADGNG